MKNVLLILLLALVNNVMTQINLKECIEAGKSNSPALKMAQKQVDLSQLEQADAKGKYLPQISLAYDYRYNPIIATQIVPVGQFNPIPTDETRAIQFGTNWQQGAGVSVYQPLLDLVVQSKIRESKLQSGIKEMNARIEEEDLIYEIVKSYSSIVQLNHQLASSVADTSRSYSSLNLVLERYKEGKELKSEVNNASLNHNSNLTQYRRSFSELMNEKVYLAYLTGIRLERIMVEVFEPIPTFDIKTEGTSKVNPESLAEYQKLSLEEQLLTQQINTQKRKYIPSIGLTGYLGANQFSDSFDPFLEDSWFGNSYVGLSIKLPIFMPNESINAVGQLENKISAIGDRKEELTNSKQLQLLQATNRIQQLSSELEITKKSLLLMTENVTIYQERFRDGQISSLELNRQETELQKLTAQIYSIEVQLNMARVEWLRVSGLLKERI